MFAKFFDHGITWLAYLGICGACFMLGLVLATVAQPRAYVVHADGCDYVIAPHRSAMAVLGLLSAKEIELIRGEQTPIRTPGTGGRNQPCPCGSGRKTKKCCKGVTRNGTAVKTHMV